MKGENQMEQYRVCEDLQGGGFGMERVYTIPQWIEQAQEWAEMDENPGLAHELQMLGDRWRDGKISDWGVLDQIAEIWTIEFEKITDEHRGLYKQYLKDYHKHSYGEPVCFEEWLDNEWEEIVFDRKMKKGIDK